MESSVEDVAQMSLMLWRSSGPEWRHDVPTPSTARSSAPMFAPGSIMAATVSAASAGSLDTMSSSRLPLPLMLPGTSSPVSPLVRALARPGGAAPENAISARLLASPA